MLKDELTLTAGLCMTTMLLLTAAPCAFICELCSNTIETFQFGTTIAGNITIMLDECEASTKGKPEEYASAVTTEDAVKTTSNFFDGVYAEFEPPIV